MIPLKTNVVGLARNIKDTGVDKARVAADYVVESVTESVEELKDASAQNLKKVESRIKGKPGQSVAIAFAAGFLASFLFGRGKA